MTCVLNKSLFAKAYSLREQFDLVVSETSLTFVKSQETHQHNIIQVLQKNIAV